ncbi:MAG: hypothetical protein DELT_00513 [Desulfovibrio sp.]
MKRQTRYATPEKIVTFTDIIEEALLPLDSLTALLLEGGHEDVAAISAGLLRDTRIKLQSAVRCLEAETGNPLLLLKVGDVLCPKKPPS